MSPYEEIFLLNKQMKEAKRTLETSDYDMFEEVDLRLLITLCDELKTAANIVVKSLEDE